MSSSQQSLHSLAWAFGLALCLWAAASGQSEARIGVGVGTGKISVNETLLPGKSYELPPLTVINTGDERAEYGVGVSYHEQQPERMPEKTWFTFSPERFWLDPGQSQIVSLRLDVPVRAAPGAYFAYIEGRPFVSTSAETRVNVAAASKLNFEVGTSGLFASWYHKGMSVFETYRVGVTAALIIGLILLCGWLFKRFFRIQIGLKE